MAACCSETSVDFQQTTRCYISGDRSHNMMLFPYNAATNIQAQQWNYVWTQLLAYPHNREQYHAHILQMNVLSVCICHDTDAHLLKHMSHFMDFPLVFRLPSHPDKFQKKNVYWLSSPTNVFPCICLNTVARKSYNLTYSTLLTGMYRFPPHSQHNVITALRVVEEGSNFEYFLFFVSASHYTLHVSAHMQAIIRCCKH
jgi:hypothetical protein